MLEAAPDGGLAMGCQDQMHVDLGILHETESRRGLGIVLGTFGQTSFGSLECVIGQMIQPPFGPHEAFLPQANHAELFLGSV